MPSLGLSLHVLVSTEASIGASMVLNRYTHSNLSNTKRYNFSSCARIYVQLTCIQPYLYGRHSHVLTRDIIQEHTRCLDSVQYLSGNPTRFQNCICRQCHQMALWPRRSLYVNSCAVTVSPWCPVVQSI